MMSQIKENLFSPHSFVLAAIYVFCGVGIFSAYLFVRIQISGAEVDILMPTTTAMKSKLGR